MNRKLTAWRPTFEWTVYIDINSAISSVLIHIVARKVQIDNIELLQVWPSYASRPREVLPYEILFKLQQLISSVYRYIESHSTSKMKV